MRCELCKGRRKVRVWTSTDSGLIKQRIQDCPRCSGGPAPFKELPVPIKPPRNLSCHMLPLTRGEEGPGGGASQHGRGRGQDPDGIGS